MANSKKRKNGGILRSILKNSEMPVETVPNLPTIYITVCGKMCVNISCVKRIIEYRSDFLKLKAGKLNISVYGEDIVIKKRRDGSLDIEGVIEKTELV